MKKLFAENKIFLIILVIAILFRFIGTNPGYNKFHSDEGISYSAAVSMIKNSNFDPLRYDYPALVPLINYIFFKTIFIPLSWGRYYLMHLSGVLDGTVHIPIAKLEAQRIFQVIILGEREINALFWGRYVTALFSLGNVFLVYLLGRKLFSKKVSLLTAFLLAVNFRAVVNSHIGLPDTYNAFFLLLSLIFSYRIVDSPTPKNYLLAGIFLGLSISTKYQVFAVFPFLISHIYVSWSDKKSLPPKILVAAIAAAGVFILFNPYHLVNYEKTIDILSYVSKKYAMGRTQLMTYPFWYLANIDYGWPIFAALIVGLVYSLKKFTRQSLFLLSILTPFFFVMVYYSGGGFYIRNFVTVTPILIIFAAAFLSIFPKYLLPLLLLPLVFTPLKNSVINSYYSTKPWTYDEILAESEKILPESSLVASHPFDPLPGDVRRVDFERPTAYSLSEFREEKADYALVNMDWASNDFYGWMTEVSPRSLTYFQKPLDKMRNVFSGLAIEEMVSFTVASSFKPWQAPDAALFLVKVPYFENVNFLNPRVVELNETIAVKPGYVYRVSGPLASNAAIEKDRRDVFLRADFLNSSGSRLASSVSGRYFGSSWQKAELLAIAPSEAGYMRVLIQAYQGTTEGYNLKSAFVEESNNPYKLKDDYKRIDFDKYKDLLYPNSHGNL